jgi:hypothetical protein
MRFTRWDQQFPSSETNKVLLLLSRWHLSQCEGKERDEIFEAICHEDYFTLCHYELSPAGNVSTYLHLRQVLAFFQKRSDLDLGIDKKRVAADRFVETEARNRETNAIFRLNSRGGFYFHPRVESILFIAQRKISSILGDAPTLADLKLRFGPGATTQVKKKDASVRRKLAQRFACSEDSLRFLPELLSEMPLWSQVPTSETESISVDVDIHPGRIDFVRKTAKTDRQIGVEPALTGMVQLALGDIIADRLRPWGVDIRDQTRNQRLARLGSIDGGLATLDLSDASNLMASGLVESLLPFDWWDLLRAFRTGNSTLDNQSMRLEMFSSMGNGFTFALETLIFFALAKACEESTGRGEVSVYGDDIIVPVSAYDLLVNVLTCVGFKVNSKKSFSTGPFRESCGKDYFSGIDVRPCYVKASLTGQTCFTLHNFYVRGMQPVPAQIVLDSIDESLRLWGPDGYGDGHLLGDHSSSLVPHKRELGWGGYTFETYTYKRRKAFYSLGADYVYPAYSIYIRDREATERDSFDEGVFTPASNPLRSTLSATALRAPRTFSARFDSRASGNIRPDRSDAVYARSQKGKPLCLVDTLPGVDGYKRIKIYITGL